MLRLHRYDSCMPDSALDKTDSNTFPLLAQAHDWLISQASSVDDGFSPAVGQEIVDILLPLGVDEEVLVAGLLSDPGLEDGLELDIIQSRFGDGVSMLVDNVRQINQIHSRSSSDSRGPEQAERLRRLLLAVIDDVRAVLIKLALRLVRLRHLEGAESDERLQIARESLDIFAPLANRLGVAQLKWEMEDLAFRRLEPVTYKSIARQLEDRRIEREEYIEAFKQRLAGLLHDAGIDGEITGRPKHIYSIWKKLQRKEVGLDELYDLRALRVIVEDVAQCYSVLGVVHTHWNTLPKEFDDYLANPKPNGYRSLHTVVVGPRDLPVEIQIRTREMQEYAELGFAAHWRYKESSSHDDALQAAINSLRNLLLGGESDEREKGALTAELFPDRVFVMTPEGDVVELGRGATPLDFAYAVHTELGHRCRGAKVNDHIVPLSYALQTGEKVEILAAKQAQPSRDWMNPNSGYLASAKARAKVRAWWHQQDMAEHLRSGRKLLEQTRRKWAEKEVSLDQLLSKFGQPDEDALFVAIGRGEIRSTQLEAIFRPRQRLTKPQEAEDKTSEVAGKAAVAGVENLLTRVAKCCKPLPGDEVVGYITQGQGITVHRRDCGNLAHLPEDRKARVVDIEWGRSSSLYPVTVRIRAHDREGLLRDITQELSSQKVTVLKSDSFSDLEAEQLHVSLTLQVGDTRQLQALLAKLRVIKGITQVNRE